MTISANIRDRAGRRGQTLVEALVALTILMTGFVGITTLLAKSFQLNRLAADETQATYLAAEGIEVAKNIIDYDVYSGIASGGDGTTNWGNSFPRSGYYLLDYETVSTAGAFYSPNVNNPPNSPLYFDPATHLFGLTNVPGDVSTDFTRSIYVERKNIPGSPGIPLLDVQSTVTWNNGVTSNSVTLEDQFYDWHP